MPPHQTNPEIAAVQRELEQVKNRVGQLESQRNDAIDALAAATGLTRRQVLGIIAGGAGMGALGVLASGQAQAAAQPSGGEGDVGSTSTPFEGFADGMALVTTDISSATTVTKPVVRYDCSISGFTITLGQELEGPSGFAQRVVLIDETGNAGSNAVTADTESGNGIDGGTSITINHDDAVTILWWDGSEWRSTRFIDSVDAGTVTIGGSDTINQVEFGTATTTGPSAQPADDGWDTVENVTKSVSFGTTFDSTPEVVAVPNRDDSDSAAAAQAALRIINKSTTGFDLIWDFYHTTDISTDTVAADWVAIT